jgi:Domain of unknown function (DUF6798)
MTPNISMGKRIAAGSAAFLAWSAVFALVYTQLPLYHSNQYQYFLHGMASAGYGFLKRDWLAGTADPTPLFSAMVDITLRIFHSEAPTYMYYGLLMGVYLFSLYGIADAIFRLRRSTPRSMAFLAAFLVLHSSLFRFALSRIWNGEAAYLFEGGVAEQQVLGQFFQPSVFGVFLLLSIFFFLRGRKSLSILSMAAAIYFHATYLLAGALLTLGYLAAIGWRERSTKAVLQFGFLTLLAVTPVLAYELAVIGPSSSELFRQASQILSEYRLQHHTEIIRWFRWTVVAKAVLIAAALWIVRRARIFPIMGVAALGMLALSLIQWKTGSDSLALLFPWRISVILVPLSSTLLLAAGVQWIAERVSVPPIPAARWLSVVCLMAIVLPLGAGIARIPIDLANAAADPARPMLDFVRAQGTGEVYFIPPKLESFRLETGAPAFVDQKSIPYRDTDVVEWYRRLALAESFYDPQTDRCAQAQVLAATEGTTLFVIPSDEMPASCPAFSVLYRDSEYGVVRVIPEPASP